MKNSILSLSFIFCVGLSSAQTNQGSPMPFIKGNKTTAMATERGINLYNIVQGRAGYLVDIENNLSAGLIFASHFWFGGISAAGELKVSADTYGNNQWFRQGPISTNNQYNHYNYLTKYFNSRWKVSKAEIIYHIDNYNQPGYVMPDGIKLWPGNGDASVGVGTDMAPFIDVDGDGVYNPHLGDYPCIKGDVAHYTIYNDDVANNPNKLGIEMHLMLYQFASNNYIDSTTFMQLRVVNRGIHSFPDFKTAIFADFDIGGSEDDYMGTNPIKKMLYGYNGDNFDQTMGAANGFQENPPACGIVSLNKALSAAGLFWRTGTGYGIGGFSDDPNSTGDYWNYMNAKWKDGSPYLNGGPGFNLSGLFPNLQPTNFLFDGNPATNTGWSELSLQNFPGDRRGFMTMEGQQLNPGQSAVYDLAIIMNRSGDHLQNVGGLFNYADLVQSYYNSNLANHNCILQGSGIAENHIPFDWTPWMVGVERLDGRGNMGFAIDLEEQFLGEALWQNQASKLKYKKNKSPIYVKVENPGNHALGKFVLEFHDYAQTASGIDTASWTIYRYDINSGQLLDQVSSENTIDMGELQYIPQWGISVVVKQKPYIWPFGALPVTQNLSTNPIEATIHFDTETTGWLTGVEDIDGIHPQNWILSGYNAFDDNPCFSSRPRDYFKEWQKLLDGTVSHFNLIRSCGAAAPVGSNTNLNIAMAQDRARIASTPSVDLVFTHEKEKWTRCVVVEMSDDPTLAQGGAQKMKPRNAPSVDKNGHSAGHPDYNAEEGDLISATGMGWFPGFAIDVETGRRLNVVFGENSFMLGNNGADMLWNPTTQMYDQVGNPIFGGQHVVYVIGESTEGFNSSFMPIYDSCAHFFSKINSTVNNDNRDAWQNASWTMYPMLSEGHTLLEKPVLLRLRVSKRYEDLEITGANNGSPAFQWNISQLLPANLSLEEHVIQPELTVFPNPAENLVNLRWDNMHPAKAEIYSSNGIQVKTMDLSASQNSISFDVKDLPSGLYFIRVGDVIRKLIVK